MMKKLKYLFPKDNWAILVVSVVITIGAYKADVYPLFPDWSSEVLWALISILFLLFLFFAYKYFNEDRQLAEIPSITDAAKRKHTILVIDDDKSYLKKIVAKIKEQDLGNVIGINALQDRRLVDAFEIIVSDINGIGSLKDAKDLLETIKKNYPYKIIIPISSSVLNHNIKVDEKMIMKDENQSELTEITKRISETIDKINDTKSFWAIVENSCKYRKMNDKEVEKVKKGFIRYINDLNEGWI